MPMLVSFERLANAIVSTQGNIALCSLIVVFALAGYFAYFKPKLQRSLAGLSEAAEQLTSYGSEEAFAEHFEEFDQFVKDRLVFNHSWQEFTEALVPGEEGAAPPVLRHSQPPAEFFNVHSLLEGRLNIRLVTAVPSYLTGLGILGTFIGLVAGIYLASKGMNAENVTLMRQSLQPLLSGAALAFWTSICGLLCSILFSVFEKRALHRADQAVGAWNSELERRLRRVTPEQLAIESGKEAAKQTLQLERFNTDLAVSIAEALDRQLSQRFSPRIDQLVTGLEDLKGQQASFSHDVMNTVTKELTKALSGAAGTEMMAVTETLAGLVRVLQQTSGSLSQGQQEVASAITQVIARLEGAFTQGTESLSVETAKTIERIARHLDEAGGSAAHHLTTASEGAAASLGKAAERIASTMEGAAGQTADRLAVAATDAAARISNAAVSVEVGAAKYQQTLGQMHNVLRAASDASAGLRATLQALQETHGAIRGTVEPLSSGIARLSQLHESVGAQLEHTKSLSAGLTATALEVKQTLVTLQQTWGNHERRFEDLDASAEKFFVQIREGVDSFTGAVRGFVGELDASFAKSMSELSSVVNELETTIDDLEQVLRRRPA